MAGSHDSTLGVLFIAGMIGASLWGVSNLQVYSYFNSCQQDPKWLKAPVIMAWSLDTLHQIFISYANYIYLITNWGVSPPTTRIVWSIHAQVHVNVVLAFIVQSFFMFRIWKLSKRNIFITTPVAALVLAQFIGYMVHSGMVYAQQVSGFSQLASLRKFDVALNILTATTDVSLATALIYLLHKSRTGFKRADTMIKKLIVFAINTGLLTSLNALCALIAYLASPHTLIHTLFYFIMARLYVNSLMANLNARSIISSRSSYVESLSIGDLRTPSRTGGSRQLSFAREEQTVHEISVKVDTVLEMRGDLDHIV